MSKATEIATFLPWSYLLSSIFWQVFLDQAKYVKFSLGKGRELSENTWTLLLKSQYDFHSTYESNMESMSKDGVFLSNHAHVMISFMLGVNVISFTNSSKSIE